MRVPSWLSEGEWAEPGMVPGPCTHSQLCLRPATDGLHHATQEHGNSANLRPVTRVHRHRQRAVTGRQEVGTAAQKEITTGGRLHKPAGSDVQRAGAQGKDPRRGDCCDGVWSIQIK